MYPLLNQALRHEEQTQTANRSAYGTSTQELTTLLENDDLLHQTLLHSVLGENLEDAVHTASSWNVNGLLHKSGRKNVQGESLENLQQLQCQHSAATE